MRFMEFHRPEFFHGFLAFRVQFGKVVGSTYNCTLGDLVT